MNAPNTIVLGGILTLLIIVEVRARAIPDFNTDEDLNAWHKFGLRSFYGPWSVIARKPNGDFVSYADYGARVPSDFRPISDEDNHDDDFTYGNFEDDSTRGNSPVDSARGNSLDDSTRGNSPDDSTNGNSHADRPDRQYPSKYAAGLSDFAAGYGLAPYGLAVFSNGVQPSATATNGALLDHKAQEDNAITLNSTDDLQQLIKAMDGKATNKESKRDTLELIGIVGVISDEGNSSDEDSTPLAITEIATSTENGDSTTTVTDHTLNVTS